MLTEYDLIPLLWVRALTSQAILDLRQNFRQDPVFRESLHNRTYLLQEVAGAGLNLNFRWGRGLFSTSLVSTFEEILDPSKYHELTKYLSDHNLTVEGKAKIELTNKLTQPPEHWSGDCEPVWLRGEASLLYLARFEPREPIQTFRDRAVQRLTQHLSGIPKPLAYTAYDRLVEFDSFRIT